MTEKQSLALEPIIFQTEGPPIKAFTHGVPMEDSALRQLQLTASLKLPDGTNLVPPEGIAVMPDVHVGKGSTIGSVIPTSFGIIPAAVGVDIGCGMMAVRTPLKAENLPDNLFGLKTAIDDVIPHGGPGVQGSWEENLPGSGRKRYSLPMIVTQHWYSIMDGYQKIVSKNTGIRLTRQGKARKGHPVHQLGTLGTGNHFIEICLDADSRVWALLHSGSRGIGNQIGEFFIHAAKERVQRGEIYVPLDIDKQPNLAWLEDGSPAFQDYIQAMTWAQDYAWRNRQIMMTLTLQTLYAQAQGTWPVGTARDEFAVNCHHNYAVKEVHFNRNIWVTRKGAIKADVGDLGIIPGSMGTGSFIVEGRGHPESYNSAPHGAGRKMSRSAAKRAFTVADLKAQTEGVVCRTDAGVLDEIPGAYKDISDVMKAAEPLVKILYRLKQVVNVKG